MIKLIILYVIKFILSFFKLFPLKKNQCFFMSYNGTQYSCNPRAIYEYLNNIKENMIFVWATVGGLNIPSYDSKNKLVIVKSNTIKYYFYLITSKYVFVNIELQTYLPKKKKSVWINTWHGGGAFKRVEYPATNIYAKVTKRIQCKHTDYYISSSEIFTKVMALSTGFPKKKFWEIGMPRNDIFFENESVKYGIRKRVFSALNIPKDYFVVLYAPTYRGIAKDGEFEMSLDIESVKQAFERRFSKKIAFLIRSHHAVKHNARISEQFIDASVYPDMQDLLIVADSLITDYSSCIFDFALTKKPGFLFAPDLENYRQNRGFYTDISEWAFAFSKNNEELCELINTYDELIAIKKCQKYLEDIGSFEKGSSLEHIEKLVNSLL